MDLALAHHSSELFREKGTELDPWQSVSLWHACRNAKEQLLVEGGPETQTVSVLGRGSKLIGGTVSVELERSGAASLITDGFFPACELSDRPQRPMASGFQDIGLAYESDPAVTRHVADFLTRHGDGAPIQPNHILLNGGVFRSDVLRSRLMSVITNWFDSDTAPSLLDGVHDLDNAVSLGAAFYGWTRANGAPRIRGGTACSWYIGIETAGLAIPGAPRPVNALCVVPQGMEEGSSCDVPSAEIGLAVGESARFRFFGSTMRPDDQPGSRLTSWSEEELIESAPVETRLDADDTASEQWVPVKFHSTVTELGVLELWCVNPQTDQRWKLEFSVRESS